MALGYDAAGGVAEKFLPAPFSIPVLMNTVLPGLLVVAALYPFAPPEWQKALSVDVDKSWLALAIAMLVVLVAGALVSALNGEFYKIYEGRTSWPGRLSDWAVSRQQNRVDRLYRQARAEKEGSPQRYDEIWYQLRIYPIDPKTGDVYATHPTLLGNILAAYEKYPYDRYGMDSVFYWPRLWMVVEKDLKEEIGNSWAKADGLLNLSAVSFLAGLLWLGTTILVEAGLLESRWRPVDGFVPSIEAFVGWFALGYALYRLSLSFHRKNGEVFKSLFDMYRDKLKKLTSLTPSEKDLWEATWAYLQYLLLPCPSCGKTTVSISTSECTNQSCRAHVPETVDDFRRSGAFIKTPKAGG
jgi:hypothetical protein